MYRTHYCGELRIVNLDQKVSVAGWVQRVRKMGGLLFVDLRDREGIVQLVVADANAPLLAQAESLGREWVITATGIVRERSSKNPNIPTGDVEIELHALSILNKSEVPPFTIETETDGGEELRMKYRYLDIRRKPVQDALLLRHRMAQAVRTALNERRFIEIETPFLIKSTPEGARDFVVPSRLHTGEFYALPQSPQTFKQLLMVAGMERYYQIVRCFRDEDLRADRQPEFTQIDCELSFVQQEDILQIFEEFMAYLFQAVLGITIATPFRRMSYNEAMAKYGSDKPDLRVAMEIGELTDITRQTSFPVFDNAEYVGGICVKGSANYTRKQLDALTEYVKRPQIGATGLVYARIAAEDGTIKSSADKFLAPELLQTLATKLGGEKGDLLLFMAGKKQPTQIALGALRLEVARNQNLLDPKVFCPLWVIDFPLFEWDDETQRYYAMHHPFTSPHPEDIPLFESNPGAMRANAYDMVINGTEVGGGSIRIFDREVQTQMFRALGFTEEQAQAQFGFLLDAFRYGAPPHGGIAFGFDRLCALFGGSDSIRDYIAFPKNNAGRDVMSASPAPIDPAQLAELHLRIAD